MCAAQMRGLQICICGGILVILQVIIAACTTALRSCIAAVLRVGDEPTPAVRPLGIYASSVLLNYRDEINRKAAKQIAMQRANCNCSAE